MTTRQSLWAAGSASASWSPTRTGMGMGCIGARAVFRSGVRPLASLAAALSAGALLVTGGCTPSQQPTPTGTTSATASTSPRATSSTTTDPPTSNVPTTDPGIPPAARPNTIAGAEAFVRYYVQRLNEAARTANPALLDGLTGPGCPACNSLREDIENYQAEGTHLAGDMWKLTQVITGAFDGSQAVVELTVVQVRVDIVDRDGRPVSYIKDSGGRMNATLAFNSTWRVARLQAI